MVIVVPVPVKKECSNNYYCIDRPYDSRLTWLFVDLLLIECAYLIWPHRDYLFWPHSASGIGGVRVR